MRALVRPLSVLAWLTSGLALASTSPFLLPFSSPVAFQEEAPGEFSWENVISQDGGDRVRFGLAWDGLRPYARNLDAQFIPASNTKIFTTAAVLEKFGPNFVYETRVRWKEVDGVPGTITDLVLIGAGDPTWGMEEFGETLRTRFDEIAKALYEHGVRRIVGDIHVAAADFRLDTLRFPEGWLNEDRVECYASLAQSFNLQTNCAAFVIEGPRRGYWKEFGVPIPVELSLTSGPETEFSIEPLDASDRVSVGFVIRGTWAPGSRARTIHLPIHDSPGWARNLMILALKDQGVRFKRPKPGLVVGPDQEMVLRSPELRQMVRPFMKESINPLGDAFIKLLGRAGDSPDLLLGGQIAFKTYLSSVIGQTDHELGPVQLWDGSGISRTNSVSPGQMLRFLKALMTRADFPLIWDSFPVAGVDGTLSNRMRGTSAEGVLRGKTGTLRGIYNLSGYVPKQDSSGTLDYIPFVMFGEVSVATDVLPEQPPEAFPTLAEGAKAARAAEDRIGAWLAKFAQFGTDN